LAGTLYEQVNLIGLIFRRQIYGGYFYLIKANGLTTIGAFEMDMIMLMLNI
jgi:hypothetical protein